MLKVDKIAVYKFRNKLSKAMLLRSIKYNKMIARVRQRYTQFSD